MWGWGVVLARRERATRRESRGRKTQGRSCQQGILQLSAMRCVRYSWSCLVPATTDAPASANQILSLVRLFFVDASRLDPPSDDLDWTNECAKPDSNSRLIFMDDLLYSAQSTSFPLPAIALGSAWRYSPQFLPSSHSDPRLVQPPAINFQA